MKKRVKKTLFLVIAGLLLLCGAVAFLPLPGTIPVLMYHFIGSKEQADQHKLYVSRESFTKQMAFLKMMGYRILSLDEYYAIRSGQKKSKGREIVITFDDGNYSFFKEAYPILQQYRFPVAVFLVSESIRERIHGSMTIEDLMVLKQEDWIGFGSHSKTHPILTRLSDGKLREELEGSREDLEAMLGVPVVDFAYPSGEVDERVIRFAKAAGYRQAFTTSYKKVPATKEELYALPRVKITRTSDLLIAYWFKVSGLYQWFKRLFAIW